MSVLRVLTVDDEALALRRLKLLLQAMPYAEHVGEANSCAEALAEIAALTPDAVLLDIKMRDGDGFEVIEALAERPNPPAVIFVTAFDHFAVRAFESAVVDYLLKPVKSVIFRARVGATLERKRLRDIERLRLIQVQHERKLLELEQEKSERLEAPSLCMSVDRQIFCPKRLSFFYEASRGTSVGDRSTHASPWRLAPERGVSEA